MNVTDAAMMAEFLELELARAECRKGDGGALIVFRPTFSVECVVSLCWRGLGTMSVRTPTQSVWQFIQSRKGGQSYPPHAGFVRPALSNEVLENLECDAAQAAFTAAFAEEKAPCAGGIDGTCIDLELFHGGSERRFELHSLTSSPRHPVWRFVDAVLELTSQCTWHSSRSSLDALRLSLR
ncbi:MAG: hypothetical protein ABTQ32_18790 [Myxococcaceae bacterium]